MGYHRAMSDAEIPSSETSWMDHEDIMLSKTVQTEKDKSCVKPTRKKSPIHKEYSGSYQGLEVCRTWGYDRQILQTSIIRGISSGEYNIQHSDHGLLLLCFSHQVMSLFCDPMDGSMPGYSLHGISQGRILEWVVISFSKGSS